MLTLTVLQVLGNVYLLLIIRCRCYILLYCYITILHKFLCYIADL